MSAIGYLRASLQDRYEAVSIGNARSAPERRLARALREGLRALALALAATGIMAGLIAVRFLGFLPATFHLHG